MAPTCSAVGLRSGTALIDVTVLSGVCATGLPRNDTAAQSGPRPRSNCRRVNVTDVNASSRITRQFERYGHLAKVPQRCILGRAWRGLRRIGDELALRIQLGEHPAKLH
jgi:hypothetical protein